VGAALTGDLAFWSAGSGSVDRMMWIWKGLAFGFGEPPTLAWVADSWVWE
jgi:hypothetical protein